MVTLVTLVVWLTRDPVALTWWNLGASYLALVIESIVGIAMMNQTRRDALVLREVRALSQQMSAALATVQSDVEHIDDVVDEEVRGEKSA